MLVFLLCLFLSYRLLYHILGQTQDAATIEGVLSGLRIWLDETQARVTFSAPNEGDGPMEDKPLQWEPGATPKTFAFPQSPGPPTHGRGEDGEKDRKEDKTLVKTEQNEDSDWVSDAEAEVVVQSSPHQQCTTPANGQAHEPFAQDIPKVPSPLASALPSHAAPCAPTLFHPQPRSELAHPQERPQSTAT